jgi:hypothetical protein
LRRVRNMRMNSSAAPSASTAPEDRIFMQLAYCGGSFEGSRSGDTDYAVPARGSGPRGRHGPKRPVRLDPGARLSPTGPPARPARWPTAEPAPVGSMCT